MRSVQGSNAAPGKTAQLAERLTALRTPAEVDAQGRRRLDAAAPLDAIAREVEETILPRCLTFENDRGERLALDVASARILSVARLDLPGEGSRFGDLPGHAFFDAEDPKCALLHRALDVFVQGVHGLNVRAAIVPEAQGFTNIGITLKGLKRPKPKPSAGPGKRDADATFAACQALANGVLHREKGETVQSWGAPEAVAALTALAAEGIADTEEGEGSQRALAWGSSDEGGTVYLALGLGAASLLVAAPSENFGAIAALLYPPAP